MGTGKEESGDRTVWKKFLKYVPPADNSFFSDATSAGIYCIREVSGYAVWYRRWLEKRSDEAPPPEVTLDGNYLLKFFELSARDEAIEFAVLSAMPGHGADAAVAELDELAKSALKVEKRSHHHSPFDHLRA